MKNWFISIILVITISNAYGQFSVKGGATYSLPKSDYIQNINPAVTGYGGVSIRYYPFKSIENLSLQNELLYTRRGYDQHLNSTSKLRFSYISFPFLVNYLFNNFVSLNAGAEFSRYFSASVKKGNRTYNKWDIGLILGLDFFERNIVSPQVRVIYGLLPAFDYYLIDELGNFQGEIEDLKYTNISVGIKVKLSNEKVVSYR